MRNARALVMAAAVAALVMMIAGGPGTRLGLWPYGAGISMLRWAAWTGIAAAVGALALVVLLAVPRWRVRPWVPVLALCIALLSVVPPLLLLLKAKGVPPIHDITTDIFDPPVFVSLLEERNKSPNGSKYDPAVGPVQQKAYPDIRTLLLKGDPRETTQRAIDAARSLGWEVVASDAATGRIEATATTSWFGFKDDIVVRVRPEGTGSRLDVRSVSRVGRSDIGANAARVREFLAKLA